MTKKVNGRKSKIKTHRTQHGRLHEGAGDNSKGRKQNKSQSDKTDVMKKVGLIARLKVLKKYVVKKKFT
ncbi:MAG: hypothetical protein KatS3mg080_0994 [Anoxybacillus sp.]|nr:MAG: hypothetical protein KatS3mg080_0994 [Anoxybacillus sp.]